MIARCLILAAALGVAGPAAMPAGAAEKEVKLKTQTIKVKPARVRFGGPVSDVPFELRQLPPGKVVLKDKDGKDVEHEVKAVWMTTTEVTWPVYDVFYMALDLDNPWRSAVKDYKGSGMINKIDGKSRPSVPYENPAVFGHDGYPAGKVSRRSALQFCAWLSVHTGKKFRLPTEAEWEYACRAGGPPVKLDANALRDVAWFHRDVDKEPHPPGAVAWFNDDDDMEAHPVGKKSPNAWGFYDMLGNVAEHLAGDPDDVTKGIVAGGSYKDEAKDVHSGARERYSEAWRKSDPQDPKGLGWLPDGAFVGLRLVMEE